jgi:hypothetical protein
MKSLAMAASAVLARRPPLPAAQLVRTHWHQVRTAALPARRMAATAWTVPLAPPNQPRLSMLGSWLGSLSARRQPLHTASPFAAGVAMGGTLVAPSHYEVLSIPASAPPDAIKKVCMRMPPEEPACLAPPCQLTGLRSHQAYLKLSKECHPDRAASGTSEEQDVAHQRFLLVTQAFTVLSDPVKRHAYDSDLLRTAGRHMQAPGRLPCGAFAAAVPGHVALLLGRWFPQQQQQSQLPSAVLYLPVGLLAVLAHCGERGRSGHS